MVLAGRVRSARRGSPGRSRAVVCGLAFAGAAALVGCGDDSPDAESGTDEVEDPSTAEDEEAAFAVVTGLVAEFDQLNEEIDGDRDINDLDHPSVQRIAEILSEDHPAVERIFDGVVEMANRGYIQVPASPEGLFNETYIYEMTSDDADSIRFGYCVARDGILLDADGNEPYPGIAEEVFGVRHAHRVDGRWRLGVNQDAIHGEQTVRIPPEPGSLRPGHCEAHENRYWEVRDSLWDEEAVASEEYEDQWG